MYSEPVTPPFVRRTKKVEPLAKQAYMIKIQGVLVGVRAVAKIGVFAVEPVLNRSNLEMGAKKVEPVMFTEP
jgi:hypothetical protein